MAVWKRDQATAAVLIKAGADVNARDRVRAVRLCVHQAALLTPFPCPQCGDTPLRDAVRFKQQELVELLLLHGARASVKSKVTKLSGHSCNYPLLTWRLASRSGTKPLLH
jgi:hypothetical protein